MAYFSLLIFIKFVLFTNLYAKDMDYCSSLKGALTKPIGIVEKQWRAELERLANSRPMAEKADQLLSVLLDKKSPIVEQWMERNSLFGKDEAMIVRAWRVYFAESQLVSHPNSDAKTREIVEAFAERVGGKVFPAKERQRFERLFGEARRASLKLLSQTPNSEPLRRRVEGIKLFWFKDLRRTKTPKSPLEFLSWGVAYDPVPNVVNIGIKALEYPNDATLFAVFVHEIAHSFDPCRTKAFLPDVAGEGPFAAVYACLRDPAGIGALARDDSQLDALALAKNLGEDFAPMMRANPTCTKQDYPPEGVQADQLPEAFADWFSAEVVAKSRHAVRGLRADLCVVKELRAGSSYLPNSTRLERIYLAHPEIRRKLKIKQGAVAKSCRMIPGE